MDFIYGIAYLIVYMTSCLIWLCFTQRQTTSFRPPSDFSCILATFDICLACGTLLVCVHAHTTHASRQCAAATWHMPLSSLRHPTPHSPQHTRGAAASVVSYTHCCYCHTVTALCGHDIAPRLALASLGRVPHLSCVSSRDSGD